MDRYFRHSKGAGGNMNWKQAIKTKVSGRKYPTLKRIRVGRLLFAIANIPIGTSFLYLIAIPMMMTLSPSVWAKMKIKDFKDWRSLR